VVVEDSHADPNTARRERAARSVAAAIRAFRWDIRALSTTLALAYVAASRVSAYVLFWISAIHAGAGSLLAAEVRERLGHRRAPMDDRLGLDVGSTSAELHDSLLEVAPTPLR
jgi:fructose-1,6-bisphosphatase/inositol monophosphatase family enzyme